MKPLQPAKPKARPNVDPSDFAKAMKQMEMHNTELYMNDLYVVAVRRNSPCGFTDDKGKQMLLTHISVRRVDDHHLIDWRHKQAIKNQICGEEAEAVEIYPAESRLVDTSNQFHLWVFPEGERLPFGFDMRVVSESSWNGSVQRPFEVKPIDLPAMEAMLKQELKQL